MRLLGVNGIRCFDNPVVPNVGDEIARIAPIVEFRNTEISGMNFYEVGRFRRYRDELVGRYDDGVPTVVLGHSLGGVIGCAVAKRFKQSKVVGIITINSPHAYCGYSTLLDARGELPAPIVTFGCVRDRVVLWGAKHAASVRHTVLDVDHFREIAENRAHARYIAETACRSLFAPGT